MPGDERLDVFFGDAPAQPGARHSGQVDIVVFGDLAHKRAGARSPPSASVRGFGNRALLLALQAFALVFGQIFGNVRV